VGDGLLVAPQNRREDESAWGTYRDLMDCFAWKQVVQGFSSLASRLVEVWMVHVASSRKLHRAQVEDGLVDAAGCIRHCDPCFAIFF
jgi:hypothetical protein